VREAIEDLGAERIGHGVRVMEDERVVALARERGTVFEVCMTSNSQTGVVASLEKHPLPQMVKSGLNVTINTDDPGISRISLTDEYRVALETLGMPASTLARCVIDAVQAGFLPVEERERLIARIDPLLQTTLKNI